METEMKKKEQTMMSAEDLKFNNTNIKLNSERITFSDIRCKSLNNQIASKRENGITLIALVVTIVVLLILAGITISLVFGENGIIAKAKEAVEKTNQSAINEQEQINELAGYLDNMLNEIGGNGEEPNPPGPTLPSDGSYSEEKGVNTPNLGEGMKPIKWDETKKGWVNTTGGDRDWYDYTTKKWANAMTEDGSMWVWIPRYAYSITSGYHSSSAGNIEVEFMKGLTNETSTGRTTFQNASGQGKWNIHPAFNYGSTVSGLWIAKFEASPEGATTNTSNSEYNGTGKKLQVKPGTGKKLQVKPGVSSWRSITISNIYDVCKNYNSALNSHMMKNDEWGAVAYLSKSKYGKETEEVWINNSSSYITGSAGNSASASQDVGTTNDYTSTQGVKASTTGTVYGVYDMSGGSWEYVAAYVNNGNGNLTSYGSSLVNGGTTNDYTSTQGVKASTTGTVYGVYDMSGGSWEYVAAYVNNGNGNLTSYGSSLVNGDTKTKNMYSRASLDNYKNNYTQNKGVYGDTVYETSMSGSGSTSWYEDYSEFPNKNYPFFTRGSYYNHSTYAGVFYFSFDSGQASSLNSFRPVLLVL